MYNQNKRQMLLYIHIILMAFLDCSLGYGSRNIIFTGTPQRRYTAVNVLDTVVAYSTVHCVAICKSTEHCLSASYRSITHTCLLSYLPTYATPLFTTENDNWKTFSTDGWLLAFRAPKGIGGDVLDSFVNNNDVTTDHVGCLDRTSTACLSNYRHPILNEWVVANITKVRFSYYKSQAEVAYIEFNATASSVTSWFKRNRILDSTWTTSATDNYVAFGLEDTETQYLFPNRQFYIQLNFGGCPNDQIYSVVVIYEIVTYSCNVDRQSSYPQFVYASTSSPGYPQSGSGTDKADFMAIFVKA